jgi:hypothetical protein
LTSERSIEGSSRRVIVLILVAVLWIAVLIPTILSKLSERRSAGSIGRFHERLDLLERTGPKLVKPAYRLTGTESARPSGAPLVVPMSPPPVRPILTLVPPRDDTPVPGPDEESGGPTTFEEEIVELHPAIDWDEVAAPERPAGRHADLVARERRRLARRRRRHIFGLLCALSAVTGLLGLAHPLRGAWIASGIFLALLLAFVGLAVYGQHIEEERRHLSRLTREEPLLDDDLGVSATIRYLSEEELALYHDALADYYEDEDNRLAAQA